MTRLPALMVVCLAAHALAQTTEPIPAPPLVNADGSQPAPPAAPLPAGPDQLPAQPDAYQPPPQYQQPANTPLPSGPGQQPQQPYQPSQQQYQQQQYQQYQQYQQQQQYQQPPQQQYQQPPQQQYQQQPQQYQQQPQRPPQQQPPTQAPARSKTDGFHLGAYAFGAAGVTSSYVGLTAGLRGELDITRVAINVAYNRFYAINYSTADVNEFVIMGGYSLMANDAGRIRVMAGLDVLSTPTTTGLAPVIAINTRLGLGFIGVDASASFTPFPYRQLDLRAAAVLRFGWFEIHGGWRYQVMDVDTTGSFFTFFVDAPVVNGPYIAFGLAF